MFQKSPPPRSSAFVTFLSADGAEDAAAKGATVDATVRIKCAANVSAKKFSALAAHTARVSALVDGQEIEPTVSSED
eukprot:SAG11_NODE_34970_length_269_cov_0.605882_1_plen_76_part_10